MKNKQIDHIAKLCQNVTVLLPKTLLLLFSNAGKTEDVPEFEFDKL